MQIRSSLTALALVCSGCLNFGKVDDAKVPGDLLGTYGVKGTLTETNCGDGAFGSPATWNFDVKLSRFDDDLYWLNGREVIPGSIESDGVSFSFSSRVEAEVTPAHGSQKACTLNRSDTASGTLSSDDLDVEGFDATLSFAYSATQGSDCDAALTGPEDPETGEPTVPEGAPSGLPCSMTYKLTGTRRGEAPTNEK